MSGQATSKEGQVGRRTILVPYKRTKDKHIWGNKVKIDELQYELLR